MILLNLTPIGITISSCSMNLRKIVIRYNLLVFLLVIFGFVHAQEAKIKNRNFSISTENRLTYFEINEPQKDIHLFVRGDEEQIKKLLEAVNGHYKYQFKEHHAVIVPAKDVRQFLSHFDRNNVKLNFTSGVPLADSMLVNSNVIPLHNPIYPLQNSFKGKGVIIGIIDTGVDFEHADFKDSLGNTRILHYWEQGNAANDEPIYGYGRDWDSTAINDGLCTHVDPNAYFGHGTSVAALAAGNGLSTGKYDGVAPEADIIAVATDFDASDWNSTVADAIEYIFNKAQALGRPCVINTSLGSYYGSHDGLDLSAQMIDSLIKALPGRSVVASAGNAGEFADFHLSYEVTADTNFTWFKYNPNSSYLGYGAVFFELWADTADFNNVEFAVGADKVTPNYSFRGRTSFDNIQNRLNMIVSEDIVNGANVIGTVDTWAEIIGGQYFLQVHLYEPDSSQYNFRFMTTGSGKFDIWSTENAILDFSDMIKDNLPTVAKLPDIAYYKKPDSTQSIVSSWTCLPSVITVGNYMNRMGYTDLNGNFQSLGTTPVGEWYPTSSIGPNRLGEIKPNVIAPGNKAMTATPMYLVPTTISARPDVMDPDSIHRTSPGGTSSASPVVAGIVALLFERCPTLTHDQIMNLIQNSARSDTQTGAIPNIYYGYGKADAFNAFKLPVYSPKLTTTGIIDSCNMLQLSTQQNYPAISWSNGATSDTILTLGSANYVAFVQDNNGCYDFTDTLSLTYNPLFYTINYEDTIACVGDEIILSLPSGYSYLWLDGSTDSVLHAFVPNTYFATVTNNVGCIGYSDSVIAYFDPYLLGDFVITTGEIACSNDSMLLTLPSGYTYYYWSNGENNDSIYVKIDGDYRATVVNSNGCSGFSDTVNVSFYIAPPVPMMNNINDTLIEAPLSSGYRWYVNDSLLVQDTLQFINPRIVGYYSVEVFHANGCSEFSEFSNAIYIDVINGLSEKETQSINIYPNPSNGNFVIELEHPASIINLFDISGRIISSKTVHSNQVQFVGIAKGSYFLEVNTNSNAFHREKIIVE